MPEKHCFRYFNTIFHFIYWLLGTNHKTSGNLGTMYKFTTMLHSYLIASNRNFTYVVFLHITDEWDTCAMFGCLYWRNISSIKIPRCCTKVSFFNLLVFKIIYITHQWYWFSPYWCIFVGLKSLRIFSFKM